MFSGRPCSQLGWMCCGGTVKPGVMGEIVPSRGGTGLKFQVWAWRSGGAWRRSLSDSVSGDTSSSPWSVQFWRVGEMATVMSLLLSSGVESREMP